MIELKYRERSKSPIITYHLAIEETKRGLYIAEEWLQWRRGQRGRLFRFLSFREGEGQVVNGEMPDEQDERIDERLDSPEMLAVNTLGQFTSYPRVSALRRFITGWYLSYLSADSTRSIPEAGPHERLSASGDNLPNVIQYLKEQHEDRLTKVLNVLSRRVPRLLHPRLLPELAEECRIATARTQLMVTTHSPFFVNGLQPDELWILYRDRNGHTQARRAADMEGIESFMTSGAKLGHLWMEGHFEVGDPLIEAGGPKIRKRSKS